MRKCIFVLVFAIVSGEASAESRLVFPRILFEQGRSVGVAIANPSGSAARVTMTAYTAAGALFSGPGVINPAQAEIPAGTQLARQADQIFNPPANILNGATPTRLWMEVTSATDGITGFFLDYANSLEYMDGADVRSASISQVLTFVENTSPSSMEISIVNPQDSDADVTVDLLRADGKSLHSQSTSIKKRGALLGLLSDLYAVSYQDVVALRLKSNRPVVCFGYILNQSNKSLITLAAQNSAVSNKTLYFPQLAQGAGWATSIGVHNLSDAEAVVTITAYMPDGALFSAPAVRENPVTKSIPPGGTLRSGMTALFGFADAPLQQGWIKAETTRPSLYGYVEYGAGTNRALVAAQMEAYTKAIFSHQALDDPFFTGIAMLNTSSLAANVEMVSLKPDGTAWGKTQRVLKPGQRESLLVQQWVKAAAGNGGSIVIKSDVPLIATELFGTSSLSLLANVPPQKVTTSFDPASALPTIKVTPPLAVLETGKKLKFSASGAGGLAWHVNDVSNGDNTVGTVAPDGTYTAPAKLPLKHTVTIGARTPSGDQSGGASVNLVDRQQLVSGLSLVSAVAYFENLKRFFVAEQQVLSAPQAGDVPPAAGSNARITELFPDGTRTAYLELQNDSIGKMLPFVDAKGGNYILIAGTTSGKVFRLDVAAKSMVTVAEGLNKPNSMALDERNGNLLVIEDDKVSVVPRAKFDPALAAPRGAGETRRLLTDSRKSVNLPSPRGVAIDRCGGSIFVATAGGDLLELRGKNPPRLVVSGLSSPNEILPLYLEGVETCEDSLVLLICEDDAVAVVFPSLEFGIEFVADEGSPRDLEFFPSSSPFSPNEASIGVAEVNAISSVGIGGLYDEEDPLDNEDDFFDFGFPHLDPPGDTFDTLASSQANLVVPDILAVDALLDPGSALIAVLFSDTVTPFSDRDAYSIGGYIDFDVDADYDTGIASEVDDFSDFGDTLLGVDAYLDLFKGVFHVVATGAEVPVTIEFVDDVLLVEIPTTVADLSEALIAMVITNLAEATDIAPNALFLDLSEADTYAAPAAAPKFSLRSPSPMRARAGIPPPRRPRSRTH